MHETRNFVLVLVLIGSVVWAIVAWFLFGDSAALIQQQKIISLVLAAASSLMLLYAFKVEDKLPDHLGEVVGDIYYDVDGLSFMPIVRVNNGMAELCVYYQNRFEETVEAIVHMHPPQDSFVIRPGMHDAHFAFRADGGDFGVIHQPIGVPAHLQGQVIDIQLAAASWYPRSHGLRLRKKPGIACGSMLVDWGGAAFKTGVHEVSGEIKLENPATIHLSMPTDVPESASVADASWRQEQLAAGAAG